VPGRWSGTFGEIARMIIFIWSAIFGGILLAAFIIAAVGFHCTRGGHALIPGLGFGLPAVVLSLPVLLFCAETLFVVCSASATIPLFLGLLDIYHGIRRGEKRRDLLAGALLCLGFLVCAILLYKHPDITHWMFSHILPTPRG
jgi:hypothetical protein